ncbi:MAG: DUF748 domain-containing protein [Candidatus Omnitrophica bacterium]|nr:DUF748 domain-containing protein [Candidatus Omnitrophota bacterium]MBU1928560.1 DUF748 domain-containing protein [Candidatus Omnitrophota bacterium]
MRLQVKLLLALLVIFILGTVVLHTFVNIKGKPILINKLRDLFGREVTIGSLKAYLPYNLLIKNVEVKGLFKIDKVNVKSGAFDIFRKDFTFSELKFKRLAINIENPLKKKAPNPPAPKFVPTVNNQATPINQTIVFDQAAVTNPASAVNETINISLTANLPQANANISLIQNVTSLAPAKKIRFIPISRFFVKRMSLEDGTLNFIDRSIEGKEVMLAVDKLNIVIENLEFPVRKSSLINFELRGKIPWQAEKDNGSINLEGWINILKKDMQATLKIEGLNGIVFYPYYSNWVDLEKARIEKAKLNFNSNIQSLNNDLTAQCQLVLSDIVFKPRSAEEEELKAEKIAHAVLNIFRASNQGNVAINFTVKTKMDSPQFDFSNIRLAFEEKLTQARKGDGLQPETIIMAPTKIIQGVFKSATDLTKAVINGTFEVGQEFKQSVEGMFKEKASKTAEVSSDNSTANTTELK